MAKVSVIIPIFNTEKYLEKCIESVLFQTLYDIEIICVDDCSTDKSYEIMQKFALKDSRIKIIKFDQNKGVSAARNYGIKEAKGEYISFLDSDDFFAPDFLEKLYSKALETKADVIKGNIYNYNPIENLSELTKFYDMNSKIRENKAYFYYGFTSAIYRTNFIKDNEIYFPENIMHFEDPYFSIIVSLKLGKLDIADDAKYYYTIHEDSACANCMNTESTKSLTECIKKIMELIENENCSEQDCLIYYDFLINQIIPRCSSPQLSLEANQIAIGGLLYMLKHLKCDSMNFFKYYFLKKRDEMIKAQNMQQKEIFAKLRAKIRKETQANAES